MKRSRFTDEQILYALRQFGSGHAACGRMSAARLQQRGELISDGVAEAAEAGDDRYERYRKPNRRDMRTLAVEHMCVSVTYMSRAYRGLDNPCSGCKNASWG